MKKIIVYLSINILILSSCTSGKKALQRGDYFSAVVKSVERLKSSPDNKNANAVLKEGYPLALEWSQEEIDLTLTSNRQFKWERVYSLMNQVNNLSNQIRSTPAARKLIGKTKIYTSELKMVREKAAEDRYNAGRMELDMGTREAARIAFDHFYSAEKFSPGYKDARELMAQSKYMATFRVVIEAIPVHTQRYKLSSEFFYNKIYEFLNNKYGPDSFVRFYSPVQADKENLNSVDFLVNVEFFDFSIGNLTHTEKEETVEKEVEVESEDDNTSEYMVYTAKIKTFTDRVQSNGSVRVRIVEPGSKSLLLDEILPGGFTWINDYAIYVGDKEALNNKQLELIKRKTLPLPPEQDLFIEFTKPIYGQTVSMLDKFFRQYN